MNSRSNNLLANIDWVSILLYLLLVLIGWINIYAAVYDENHSSIFDISQIIERVAFLKQTRNGVVVYILKIIYQGYAIVRIDV